MFQKQLYYLKVQATDQGSPSLTSTSTIYVSVVDVNDNAPIFQPTRYSVEVSESVAVGSYLTTVYATDGDSGKETFIDIDEEWGGGNGRGGRSS